MASMKFNRSLLKICKDLTEDDVGDLKFMYRAEIPKAELSPVTNGRDLFELLLERDFISSTNLDDLIENLEDIPRIDLAKRCVELMKRTDETGCETGNKNGGAGSTGNETGSAGNETGSEGNERNETGSEGNETGINGASGRSDTVQNNEKQPSDDLPISPSSVPPVTPQSCDNKPLVGVVTPHQPRSSPIDENETPLKKPVSGNDSPQPSSLTGEADENETPLKTPVAANATLQSNENMTLTEHQHQHSLGSDCGTVIASMESSSIGSQDAVADGPGSYISDFHCSVSLKHGKSLIDKEEEAQQQRKAREEQPNTTERQRRAREKNHEDQNKCREQAAKALINRNGVDSVESKNDIELPMSAGSSSYTSSSHYSSSSELSSFDIINAEVRTLSDPPDAIEENPLAVGIAHIVERVSLGGMGNSFSVLSPGATMHEGSQQARAPQCPIRTHVVMTADEREANEAMSQGARPRDINTGATSNNQPQNGNQQRPSLSPENQNRVVSFNLHQERSSRSRNRSHSPRPDRNHVSSNRTAQPPAENNKADGDATEEPRVRQQSPSPPPRARHNHYKEKELRGYQNELAEVGLAGNNCIICAPTGSGKTMTAGHICKERRKLNLNRRFKTLFIVCIRNLVNQQSSALKEMFPDEPNVVKSFGEESDDRLTEAMDKHDVVVLTAQILVNSLRENLVSVKDIDLLILDECHHANLDHPYNNIMRMLLQVVSDNRRAKVPQVIGLTASLGVGSNNDKPLDHYIKMCANLNCSRISYVRNKVNQDELLRLNPKPSQDQIKPVPPRQNDTFSSLLRRMARKIERKTFFFGKDSSPALGTQQYNAWVVKAQQMAESIKDDTARDTIDSCEALNVLNTALEYYEDLRATDVLGEYLDKYFTERALADEALPHKRWIFDRYAEISEALQDAADIEGVNDQPKLGALQELLVELFTKQTNPKAILLTRTVFSTIVLLKFVEESQELNNAEVKADRLVGKGKKNGCMTDEQQEEVLKKFRDDRINLLIATDVAQEGLDIPKCNLLIRYNFVSNEIGSVQAKGRARAKQSECYLILNAGSLNERRELENLQREHKMQEALKDIDRELEHELDIKIRLKREELLEKYRMDVERKQKRGDVVRAEDVIIVCRHCKLELGRGNDMVKKGSQYIMTAPDFPQRTGFRKYAKGRDFRYDIQLGVTYCINPSCQEDLGQKMQYKHGNRSEGYTLTIKNIRFRILNHEKAHDPNNYEAFKKWSVVPFHSQIEEEKLGD